MRRSNNHRQRRRPAQEPSATHVSTCLFILSGVCVFFGFVLATQKYEAGYTAFLKAALGLAALPLIGGGKKWLRQIVSKL